MNLAPNGKPSNLTPEQYALVRTPDFKAWFGDWENSPENASKVVDENSEPLVVYHGAEVGYNKRFYVFTKGSYFTDNFNSARYYSLKLAYGIEDVKEEDTTIYECFLNIKKPKTFDYKNEDAEILFHDFDENDKRIKEYESNGYNGVIWEYDYVMYDLRSSMSETDWNNLIKTWENNPLKKKQDIDDFWKTTETKKENHFIIFNPNQIKLADGSNTTFDGSNPDIRFAKGGKVKETIKLSDKDFFVNIKNMSRPFELGEKSYSTGKPLKVYRDFSEDRIILIDGHHRISDKITDCIEKIFGKNLEQKHFEQKEYIKKWLPCVLNLEFEVKFIYEKELIKGGYEEDLENDFYDWTSFSSLSWLVGDDIRYADGGIIREIDVDSIRVSDEIGYFNDSIFNELEDDEILEGFVITYYYIKEIGLVNVEDDKFELGVGYIWGLEVFEEYKGKGFGKKIMEKIFILHPTQYAFRGKATKTSKGFWLNLGAEFDESDEYSFILLKNKVTYADGGVLNYKKAYKRGGGGYTTIVNGKLVTIDKQYSDNTWVAQSEDGSIDIERETLSQIKYMLEQINNPNTELSNGGTTMRKPKLLAPNGQPSNLTPEQYRLVRTPAFKKWLGDWENDSENASKVVDENGEPLVVWHYSNKSFNKFKTPTFFAEIKNSYKTKILKNEYGVFLSIKNPLELRYKKLGKKFFNVVRKIFESVKFKDGEALIDEDIEFYMYNAYEIKDSQGFYKVLTDFIGGYNWDWAFDYAKNKGYEGLIYNETDRELTTTFNGYVVFQPNQIKLSDGTNTTFDSNNPDIRYANGGGLTMRKQKKQRVDFDNTSVVIKLVGYGNEEEFKDLWSENIIPKNPFFAWLYNDVNANEKISSGQYDLAKFKNSLDLFWDIDAKDYKGGENIISLLKGRISDDGKKIYILTMTTNPIYRRSGSMSFLIRKIREKFNIEKDNLYFVGLTDNGKKFYSKKKFDLGGTNTTFDGSNPDVRFVSNNPDIRYADGGSLTMKAPKLLAPNGKPSNLTPEQYRLVRTPAFKKWFGDWQNDAKNSSKVVDENGEPLVVYHGTESKIDKFYYRDAGIHFGTIQSAKERRETTSKKSYLIIPVFLNIRKPLLLIDSKRHKQTDFDWEAKNMVEMQDDNEFWEDFDINTDTDMNQFQSYAFKIGLEIDDSDGSLLSPVDVLEANGYDGCFYLNNEEDVGSVSYLAVEPTQIKLADGSNTTFDGNNPDIRYNKGGEITLTTEQVEQKLGRELHWWNDDIVYLSGIEYKKVYLKNEYKKIN